MVLKHQITGTGIGGGGGQIPGLGKGKLEREGRFGGRSPLRKRRLGSQLFFISKTVIYDNK